MDYTFIWVIVIFLLLWKGLSLLQFFTLLYYKFEHPRYKLCQKDEIDTQVLKLFSHYEQNLLANGFKYKYSMRYQGVIVGSNVTVYKLYYYNEDEGVHAMLDTMPYKGVLQPIRLAFHTVFESKNIAITENGIKFSIPATPESIYLFDHNLVNWEDMYDKHLNDRVISSEIVQKQSFNEEGLLSYESYLDSLFSEENFKQNLSIKTANGYRYKPSLNLLKFSDTMSRGIFKFIKMLREDAILDRTNSTKNNIKKDGLIMQMEHMHKPRGAAQNKVLWFALSLLIFSALYWVLGFSLANVIIIVTILLIHELGHFFAMRYFKYNNTSIFFLPFGAGTYGDKAKKRAYEEFIVFIMGPLPGMLISVAIIAYVLIYNNKIDSNSHLFMYTLLSLALNYINLLPIYPLDGGRIIQTLLLSRYPRAQYYFQVFGLIILLSAMLWLKDPVLLIFVFILALGLPNSYLTSELQQKIYEQNKDTNVSTESIAEILTEDDRFHRLSIPAKVSLAKYALILADMEKPSKLLLTVGMGLYILLLLAPIVLLFR